MECFIMNYFCHFYWPARGLGLFYLVVHISRKERTKPCLANESEVMVVRCLN